MHTESANTNKREHGSEYGISRLNRAPFIASMLFSFTVILLLVLLNAPIEVAMAFVFVNFVWMILLYTGRFHDVGYSGWWTLLVMCTSVAGLVALAVWPGNKVSNKYGDVPKGLFSSLLTFWHFWR
jgi:uncharacterized membrane protein YhaH (DUF805 family)